jgi:hypothetical protein
MDAFSEILSGVKLNGAVFFNAEFSAPWGFSAQRHIADTLAPGAAHFLLYHLVVDGSAFVEMADGVTLELSSGDVVIFPNGDAHHMSSKGTKPPFPNYGINDKIRARDLSPLHAGGGGVTSRFVCGYMTCDPHISRPILSGLPPVFKVNIRTDRSGQWLESSILHLVDEAVSGHVGSEAMLAKLSEALFVDTLRRYVAGLPDGQRGWLTGARDPIVGKSLGLLHRRVAHPWTIASLRADIDIYGRIKVRGRGLLLASSNSIGQNANQSVFATLICEAAAPFAEHSTTGSLGIEFMPGFSALPGLAFNIKGSVGNDDFDSVLGGITYYFGSNASLKDRQRKQDPDAALFELFQSVQAERARLQALYGPIHH